MNERLDEERNLVGEEYFQNKTKLRKAFRLNNLKILYLHFSKWVGIIEIDMEKLDRFFNCFIIVINVMFAMVINISYILDATPALLSSSWQCL